VGHKEALATIRRGKLEPVWIFRRSNHHRIRLFSVPSQRTSPTLISVIGTLEELTGVDCFPNSRFCTFIVDHEENYQADDSKILEYPKPRSNELLPRRGTASRSLQQKRARGRSRLARMSRFCLARCGTEIGSGRIPRAETSFQSSPCSSILGWQSPETHGDVARGSAVDLWHSSYSR
jgi:hypothetical protein